MAPPSRAKFSRHTVPKVSVFRFIFINLSMLRMFRELVLAMSTGLYSGLVPKAAGTCGTVVALATILPLFQTKQQLEVGYLVWCVGFTVVALGFTSLALKMRLFDADKDPKSIVIDEFAGFYCALLFLETSLAILALSFLLFRFFDILKPWPVSSFEKLPGSLGIVLDDIAAGLLACGCLQLLSIFVEWFKVSPT